MLKKLLLAAMLSVLVAAACSGAGEGLVIEGAWVRPDPLMQNAAGYMVITNHGPAADALLGVEVDFAAHASVHETVMSGGSHTMQAVPRLDLKPGEPVTLKPLSYHLMLMELNRDLVIGEEVEVRLLFEQAGVVTVTAEVRAR